MADTIIETKALTKRYGALTAVDDLNLTVRQGEVFGLLGPNGAGKTTTTLMLLGLTEPTGGTASISGVDCTRNPIQVKRFVGYLPDNMGFYPDMTGRQNLRMTGAMNGLSGDYLEARIDELVARVGMTEAVDRRAGTYSKGMKQRLGIADILIKDPDVLIMDEPTNGIDPEGMRELMALIRELAEKDGKTILISSHQLSPGGGRRTGRQGAGQGAQGCGGRFLRGRKRRELPGRVRHGCVRRGSPRPACTEVPPDVPPAVRQRSGRNLFEILCKGR